VGAYLYSFPPGTPKDRVQLFGRGAGIGPFNLDNLQGTASGDESNEAIGVGNSKRTFFSAVFFLLDSPHRVVLYTRH